MTTPPSSASSPVVEELEQENKLLKQKINELIKDNLTLSELYNPDKPPRELTLQEKLELNMGIELKKYRIPTKQIADIYWSVKMHEIEPEFVDLTFDNNRTFTSWYKVDLVKEKEEISKGESLTVDLTNANIPDSQVQLQHKLDTQNVINTILDDI